MIIAAMCDQAQCRDYEIEAAYNPPPDINNRVDKTSQIPCLALLLIRHPISARGKLKRIPSQNSDLQCLSQYELDLGIQ
jgi:hypothetical protein